METSRNALRICFALLVTLVSANAGAVSYNFDDGTLQGWANDARATENYVPRNTTVKNNEGRTVTRSGNFMLVEAAFGDRDSDTDTKILTSPEFKVTETASIEVMTVGGTGATASPSWSNYSNIPVTSSGGGFMGVALRRVSDGEYLLFGRRGTSSQGSSWMPINFTPSALAAAVEGDSSSETYVVDIIDTFTGGWGWLAADDITFSDVIVPDVTTLAFVKQPLSQVAPEGNSVTFSVDVYSANGGLQYKWFKEGDAQVRSTAAELTFQVSEKDAGKYYCVVKDGQGTTVTSSLVGLAVRDCIEYPRGDFNKDGVVDEKDLAIIPDKWLKNKLIEPQDNAFYGIYLDFLNSQSDHVMVAAHRADWKAAPENSLPAIQSCIDMGIESVEVDVRKTKDGHLILMHDSTVNRTTNGRGAVSDLTLKQIKSFRLKKSNGTLTDYQVPTLKETMVLCKGKIMVNLDKAWGIRNECMDVLKETKTVNHAIFKSGGDPASLLTQIDKLGHPINFMWIVKCKGTTSPTVEYFLDGIDLLRPSAIEIVFGDAKHPIMLVENTNKIRQRGTRVWVNTLWSGSISGGMPDSSTDTWDWMVDRGVTMIQTDSSQWLFDYLK